MNDLKQSSVMIRGLVDAEIEGKSAVQRLLVQLVQGRKDEATAKAVGTAHELGCVLILDFFRE